MSVPIVVASRRLLNLPWPRGRLKGRSAPGIKSASLFRMDLALILDATGSVEGCEGGLSTRENAR